MIVTIHIGLYVSDHYHAVTVTLSPGDSDDIICIVYSKSLSPDDSDNLHLSYNCILVLSHYQQVILTACVSANSTYAFRSCALPLNLDNGIDVRQIPTAYPYTLVISGVTEA